MKLLISLRLELVKILRQRGTWAGPAVLAVVGGLVIWGVWREGSRFSLEERAGNEIIVAGNTISALTPARFIMEPALFVLVPLLVAAVAGGLVAGEARSGVLRTWLCRPVSRLTIITAKQLAAVMHAVGLTLFLGVFSVLIGLIIFGKGDLMDMRSGDGVVFFDFSLGLKRLALAYLLAGLLMGALASIGLLCSTLFENPLTASAVTVAFLIGGGILGMLPYFDFLEPYLYNTYLDGWRYCFRAELDFADFRPLVLGLLGYTLVPYILSTVLFVRKDITC